MKSLRHAGLGRWADRRRWARAGLLVVVTMAVSSVVLLSRAAFESPSSASASDAAAARPAEKVRIGTYDSRAIAVAHGRTARFTDKFKELQRQHAEAEKAGDMKRVEQLKTQAESMQLRMHLQVFSDGPVDDVIESVRDKLPSVAKEKNVAAIVHAASYHDAAAVELIDVTDELVALFNPDKQTLKVVKDLRKRKPTPIEEVARMPIVK